MHKSIAPASSGTRPTTARMRPPVFWMRNSPIPIRIIPAMMRTQRPLVLARNLMNCMSYSPIALRLYVDLMGYWSIIFRALPFKVTNDSLMVTFVTFRGLGKFVAQGSDANIFQSKFMVLLKRFVRAHKSLYEIAIKGRHAGESRVAWSLLNGGV